MTVEVWRRICYKSGTLVSDFELVVVERGNVGGLVPFQKSCLSVSSTYDLAFQVKIHILQ